MADDVVNPSSFCHCSDHKAVHVHCFCGVCNDKAVNYFMQISHLRLSSSYGTERTEEQHKSELAASSGSDSDLHVIYIQYLHFNIRCPEFCKTRIQGV